MLGIDLSIEGATFVAEALRSGLIINCTHDHILRLLAAFIISERDVVEFLAKLRGGTRANIEVTLRSLASMPQKTETHAQP